jgi:hypothetical protein
MVLVQNEMIVDSAERLRFSPDGSLSRRPLTAANACEMAHHKCLALKSRTPCKSVRTCSDVYSVY